MKQVFIKKKNHSTLLLFFAGWGMDETPFMQYQPTNCDLMICYDYQDLFFDYDLISPYQQIKIVAWSMGVWVASKIIHRFISLLIETIAINGTLSPINNEYGIPIAIFEGTLNNLNETTLYKFQKRMCGTPDILTTYLTHCPKRTIANLYQELDSIKQLSLRSSGNSFRSWNKVYIGINDKIFPARNQRNAWKYAHTIIIDSEHYPLQLWKEILS